MGLKVVERVPGEKVDEYCKRVFQAGQKEEGGVVFFIGEKLIDLSPDMSLEYLQGYFRGFQDSENEKSFLFLLRK